MRCPIVGVEDISKLYYATNALSWSEVVCIVPGFSILFYEHMECCLCTVGKAYDKGYGVYGMWSV